jgi:hypothetical protein
MPRFGLNVLLLSASRRIEPQRDTSVAVMIDNVRRECFAADPEVRRSVR